MPDDAVIERAIGLVQDDVRAVLKGVLSERDLDTRVVIEVHYDPDNMPVVPLEEADLIATSDAVVAVPWRYECDHTGNFLGVGPTFAPVSLRGTTFVDVRDANPDNWTYHRYIDFLSALHQVGITTAASRPGLETDKFDLWENRRDHGDSD